VDGTRVLLPAGVRRPFEVFVNGVAQREGVDYEVADDRSLVFGRTLAPPRRESARSVFRGFFWGRYAPEHTVDVTYQVDGRPRVATGLPFARGQASE
jgi:hypothetical protein